MSHDAPGAPTPEQLKRVLQEAILRNYPNPERKGCAGAPIVQDAARQRLPFQHQHWEHISHCSPCYREFLEFRNAVLRRRSAERRRSRVLVVALVGLLVVGAAVYWTSRSGAPIKPAPQVVEQPPAPEPVPPPTLESSPTVTAVLNLESESITRSLGGGTPGVGGEIQRLPRARLSLSIYLPTGSEEGEYEVRLLRNPTDQVSLSTSTGTAQIENGLTILHITPDFSRYEAGAYILAIRRGAGSWRYYRIVLS